MTGKIMTRSSKPRSAAHRCCPPIWQSEGTWRHEPLPIPQQVDNVGTRGHGPWTPDRVSTRKLHVDAAVSRFPRCAVLARCVLSSKTTAACVSRDCYYDSWLCGTRILTPERGEGISSHYFLLYSWHRMICCDWQLYNGDPTEVFIVLADFPGIF